MKSTELFRKHSGLSAWVPVFFATLLCTVLLGTPVVIAQDTTAPEIDHTPVTEGWVDNPIVISATVTDNEAMDKVYLNYTDVDGARHNVTMTLVTGDTYNYTIPAQSSAGTLEYFIWANDTGDNQNVTANSTITVSVDSEAPDIDHTPVTQGWVDNPITIAATVTDNAAVDEVHLNYTDVLGVESNVSMTADGAIYNYTIPAQTSAGTLEYFIWANDTGDNQNLTGNYTIAIQAADPTAPTITHTPVESATADKEVSIEATITDDVSVDSATLYYRKKGDTIYTSITMSVSGDTYTATIPDSAVTTDGVEYYIRATDGVNVATSPAANPTTSPHEIEVVDNEDPVADAGPDQMNNDEGTTIYFDGTASTDNVGIVSYEWEFDYEGNTITLDGSSPSFTFTQVGDYVVTLTVMDSEGNFDTDTMMVSIDDSTPPEVVATSPEDEATSVSIETDYVITFSEPMDTPATEDAITVDGVTIKDFDWNSDDTQVTITLSELEHDKEYTVVITDDATDVAGNALNDETFIFRTQAPPPLFDLANDFYWLIIVIILVVIMVILALRKRKAPEAAPAVYEPVGYEEAPPAEQYPPEEPYEAPSEEPMEPMTEETPEEVPPGEPREEPEE